MAVRDTFTEVGDYHIMYHKMKHAGVSSLILKTDIVESDQVWISYDTSNRILWLCSQINTRISFIEAKL